MLGTSGGHCHQGMEMVVVVGNEACSDMQDEPHENVHQPGIISHVTGKGVALISSTLHLIQYCGTH